MTEFSFEELSSAPLVKGAIYRGGAKGNLGDEVLSRLLPVGNSGGFRTIGSADSCRFVIIFTTGDHPLWKDSISDETFTYYGDQDQPGKAVADTSRKGNYVLERSFSLADSAEVEAPVFLIFSRHEKGRDMKFVGFARPKPGRLELVAHEQSDGIVQNYKAEFSILPVNEVSRAELLKWLENPDDSSSVPAGFKVSDPTAEAVTSGANRDDQPTNDALREGDVVSQISTRPANSVLTLMESIKYNEWFALGEFIDNSISSYQKLKNGSSAKEWTKPLRIDIRWDATSQTITIEDNAGGIPATDQGWGRIFELGRPGKEQDYLSVYGYGMKAAGLWWSPRILIESSVEGETVMRYAELDREKAASSDTTPLYTKPSSPETHFTRITLIGVNRNRSIPGPGTVARINGYLSSMYRVFLRGDEPEFQMENGRPWLELTVQGTRLSAPEINFLKQPFWKVKGVPPEAQAEVIEWKSPLFSIQIQDPDNPQRPLTIRGWVGILEKGKPNDAGFLMLFRGKGVVGVGQSSGSKSDLYRPVEIVGSGNTNRRQRLVGEFDISELGKSITTDDVHWSDEQHDEFLRLLKIEISKEELPIFQMAENWRPTKLGEMRESESESYEKAADGAVDAFKKADQDSTQSAPHENVNEFPELSDITSSAQGANLPITFEKFFEFRGKKYQFSGTLLGQSQDWLTIYAGSEVTKIQIDLGHRYMANFAYVPGRDPEPIFRLALMIAVAEIESGQSAARSEINRLLRGPLGSTEWEASDTPFDQTGEQ